MTSCGRVPCTQPFDKGVMRIGLPLQGQHPRQRVKARP
jgi:hypothetical protein